MDVKVNLTYNSLGMEKIYSRNRLNYASAELFFSHDSLTVMKKLLFITDNKSKTVQYQIPANETSVDPIGSSCGEVDILKVSWKLGNSFVMTFSSNSTLYDLSTFAVNLNASSLFDDSKGELQKLSNEMKSF